MKRDWVFWGATARSTTRTVRLAALAMLLVFTIISVLPAGDFSQSALAAPPLTGTPKPTSEPKRQVATPTATATTAATAPTVVAPVTETPTGLPEPSAGRSSTPLGTSTQAPAFTSGATPSPSLAPGAGPTTTGTLTPTATGTAVPTQTAVPTAGPALSAETLVPLENVIRALPRAPEGRLVRAASGGVAGSADGRASVEVGPGAAGADLRFSVRRAPAFAVPASRVIVGGVYDFRAVSPGTDKEVSRFARPLTIRLSYRLEELAGAPESSLGIYYWNEFAGEWEPVPSALDRRGRVLSAQVDHFSQYSIQAKYVDPALPSFATVANGTFSASSYPLPGGPDNADFDAVPYLVPGGPQNADFETGDLSGWTASATSTVQLGSYDGSYYARVVSGRLTSSNFVVPADAQSLHLWGYAPGASAWIGVYDGTTGAGITSFYFTSSAWQEFSFNVASMRGMTIKLAFERSSATDLRFDNLSFDVAGAFLGESNSNCETCGEPVGMTTGNMAHTWADLAIPGRGLGLALSRSYNSMGQSVRPFGRGWTFNYGMSTLVSADNSVFVTHPDGRLLAYARNQDGSYARLPGVYETLVKNPDGTFTLTDKVQTRFGFGADGKLATITDKNGNALAFSYVGGALRSVTDPAGRVLAFSYGAGEDAQVLNTPGGSLEAFPNAGFEQGSYAGWTATGTAFGAAPTSASYNYKQGTYFAYSYNPDNAATGTLTSTLFTAGRQLIMRVNGGVGSADLKVGLLLADDTEVLSYQNEASTGDLRTVTWDTSPYEGQQVKVRVIDSSTTTWIGIDDVRVVVAASGSSQAALGPGVLAFANSGFEQGSYLNWFASGTAFGVRPVTNADANREGSYYTSSYYPTNSDAATGTLTSTIFTAGRSLSFRINGGSKPGTAYVALVLQDGTEVLKTTHVANSMTLDPVTWDTSAYDGQAVRIRLVDNDTGSWGRIGADAFRAFYAGDLVQQVTDPAGRTYRYTYDDAGNLVAYTDPLGGVTAYEYGPYGMIRAIDQAGHVVFDNGYDTKGRIVEQLDHFGNVSTFTYDVAARSTTFTDFEGRTHVTVFDTSGRTVESRDGLGYSERYSYDAAGNRASATDRNGRTTTYLYDAMGNVTQVTDPLGGVSSATYDAKNNPLSKTDPLGRVTQFQYDAAGNPTKVTDALLGETVMAYDPHGQLTSVTNPLGQATTYGYDAAGNQTSTTDALGRQTTRTFDLAGRVLTETDPLSHTTTYAYRADGKLVSVTDALGRVTSYSYDAVGNRTSATDVAGHTTTYAYDAKNRLVSLTDPLGGVSAYTYDKTDLKKTVTDPLGRVTAYTHDARGKLISEAPPAPAGATTYAYDGEGNVTSLTDGTGRATLSGYDAAGRKTSATDPAGKVTAFGYDAAGNRTSVTDATSRTVTFVYDALNRLTEERDALAHTKLYGYDAAGRKTSATDPNGRVTAYGYDAVGRLTSVTDAASGVVSYEYDAAGRRTAMVDANLHRTTYGYDAVNRLTSETDPENQTTTTGYDDLNSRVTVTRADASTVVRQLDALGRTASVTRSDGTVTYSYDAAGQLTSMVDPGGTTTYGYDSAGRVTSVASSQGTLGYGYGAAGRRSSLTYPGSRAVTYAFDAAGRMASLTDWGGRTVTYGYDDAGRRTSQTSPNGTSSTWGYDAAGRLATITHLSGGTTIASFTYSPDAAGNPLSVAEVMSLIPGGTTTYSYDALSRLSTATYPDGTWSTYSYDAMGNRTQLATQGGMTTYTYSPSDRLLATVGLNPLVFTWDTRGNQTGKGTSSFTYDQANRLVASNTGVSATYTYNGEGVRTSKTVSGTATAYLQDQVGGLPRVLSETTLGLTTDYVYGLGLAFEVRPDGTARYYHPDALGSTRVATDDAGAVVSAFNYDAYGAVRQSAGEARSFTFTGEGVGPENSLVFLRARYLDPTTGRFLQRDAFAGNPTSTQSLNRYGYTEGNPVIRTDPDGHWVQIVAGAGLGALVSYGAQVIGNVRDGGLSPEALTDVDWRQVGAGAVAGGVGAATFGVGTAIMGSGTLGGIGASALSGVAAGQASRAFANVASGECLTAGLGNAEDILLDAVSGGSGGAVARGLSSLGRSAARKPSGSVSVQTGSVRSAARGYIGAAEPAPQGMTRLYRAVGPNEYKDLMTSGQLRSGPSGYTEGKWFAESAEDAATWGQQFAEWDSKQYRVVAVDVPMELARSLQFSPRLSNFQKVIWTFQAAAQVRAASGVISAKNSWTASSSAPIEP